MLRAPPLHTRTAASCVARLDRVVVPDGEGEEELHFSTLHILTLSVEVPIGAVNESEVADFFPIALRGADSGGLEDPGQYPEEEETSARGLVELNCGGARFVSVDWLQTQSEPLLQDALFVVDARRTGAWPLGVAGALVSERRGPGLSFMALLAEETAATLQSAALCTLLFLSEDQQRQRGSRVPRLFATRSGAARLVGAAPPCIMASEPPRGFEARLAAVVANAHCAPSRSPVAPPPASSLAAGLPVAEFVQTEGFDSMVMPIMKGILKPLVDVVAGVLVDTMGSSLGASMGQELEAGLTDLIPLTLSRKISIALNGLIVPSVTETVTDSVPPIVAGNVRDYVTFAVTKRITDNLDIRLDKTLTVSIPAKVNAFAPRDLDANVTKTLGRVLSKSLSHTLVPSILHTMTHSPLMDYYCYYCWKDKKYCSFCTYAPQQAYYAQFYAGYYSTWYSDYYTDFYAKIMEEEEHGLFKRVRERSEANVAAQEPGGRQIEIVLDPDEA
jgi:hypothetical protein